MPDTHGKPTGLKSFRYGLLLAASLIALSGCVSAVTSDMRADADDSPPLATEENPATAEVPAAQPEAGIASAAASGPTDPAAEATGADMADVVMQPTQLNAGASSIYSSGGSVPAYRAESVRTNAAVNSLYSSGATAETGRLPVDDMPRTDAGASPPYTTESDEQSAILPEQVPVPTSVRTALIDEKGSRNAAEYALQANAETAVKAMAGETAGTKPAESGKPKTLASLFTRKQPLAEPSPDAATPRQPRQVLNRDSAAATRRASLGFSNTNLPGVSVSSLPSDSSHSEAEEAAENHGQPEFKEVASLAGLARLAPNGLWLQTENVKTGCFKPELLNVLKTVENHYGKPIIVTSGLRGVKRNRAKQSLHTRCEAADIQIAGVDKWELANYLRSLPGRGGVGTYCHTESVHIDIGPERDWNWNCRRKK
ncbi:DUF882 domain-containing protein [Shinella daejeonensis]|uniref:D-Ala-D-Ala carboxypeptidase family metallohydrolase n=1 Tax=Shinella daejeonensis TaxID=659017 RepID=UPI0020C79F75|nr:D-Ala-D-Ala carboxypeptidase family metallohydrolase [Shinella daejeonensis]MCP8893341.1 DUF882 domain-containing protein [Shinella daejeonensis]